MMEASLLLATEGGVTVAAKRHLDSGLTEAQRLNSTTLMDEEDCKENGTPASHSTPEFSCDGIFFLSR